MATIKQRKSTFSVIYWYLDNTGVRENKNGTRWKQEKRQSSEKLL